MYSRRAWLVGCGAAAATWWSGARSARAKPAKAPERVVVPVVFTVARRSVMVDGKASSAPVVDESFLTEQLEQACAIFGVHAVSFATRGDRRELGEGHARLETRADRDALAGAMQAGVVNVFVVESLRDVDDPSRLRMGVCWRKLSDPSKRYVIVAASAVPTVVAHELGHFLGNGHSYVKNNLMSYERDGGEVFLDSAQGRRSRATAARLLATKALVTVD